MRVDNLTKCAEMGMKNLLTLGHMAVNANHLHNLKLGNFAQKWKL